MLIGLTILIPLVLKKVCIFLFMFAFLTDFKKDFKKHKRFFEKFAKNNGFDPLIPENWHSVTTTSISSVSVLSFYFIYLLMED
jgi:hypothetical protein